MRYALSDGGMIEAGPKLGEGGEGVVFEALDGQRAIKLYHKPLVGPAADKLRAMVSLETIGLGLGLGAQAGLRVIDGELEARGVHLARERGADDGLRADLLGGLGDVGLDLVAGLAGQADAGGLRRSGGGDQGGDSRDGQDADHGDEIPSVWVHTKPRSGVPLRPLPVTCAPGSLSGASLIPRT